MSAAELELDYFWAYLDVAENIPNVRDSRCEHLNDGLGLYCMGGEL